MVIGSGRKDGYRKWEMDSDRKWKKGRLQEVRERTGIGSKRKEVIGSKRKDGLRKWEIEVI